jgi:hypothetical protein
MKKNVDKKHMKPSRIYRETKSTIPPAPQRDYQKHPRTFEEILQFYSPDPIFPSNDKPLSNPTEIEDQQPLISDFNFSDCEDDDANLFITEHDPRLSSRFQEDQLRNLATLYKQGIKQLNEICQEICDIKGQLLNPNPRTVKRY